MPRGKKKLTLEEKLAKVTADISGLEASLVELKKEKKRSGRSDQAESDC